MPVKPFDQMTEEEVKKQAETGLNAQEDELDKLWYVINFGAYVTAINDARTSSIDLAERLDKVPDDPVELEKAKKAYQQEFALSYFSDEEKLRVKIPIDRKAERVLIDEHDAMVEQMKKTCFAPQAMMKSCGGTSFSAFCRRKPPWRPARTMKRS